jgi:hypothetical protein
MSREMELLNDYHEGRALTIDELNELEIFLVQMIDIVRKERKRQ